MDNAFFTDDSGQVVIHVGGHVAFIDAADLETVKAIPGKMLPYKYKDLTYARFNKAGGQLMLHRLLMQAAPGENTVHIDGNGLNCVRSNMFNLRFGADKEAAIQAEVARRFVEAHPEIDKLRQTAQNAVEKLAAKALKNGAISLDGGTISPKTGKGYDRPQTDIQPVRGVSWHRATGRWFASGYHQGTRYIVGYYHRDKLEQANADMEAFRQRGPSMLYKPKTM